MPKRCFILFFVSRFTQDKRLARCYSRYANNIIERLAQAQDPGIEILDVYLQQCVKSRNIELANKIFTHTSKNNWKIPIAQLTNLAYWNVRVNKPEQAEKVLAYLISNNFMDKELCSKLLERYCSNNDLVGASRVFELIGSNSTSFGEYNVRDMLKISGTNAIETVWKIVSNSPAALSVIGFAQIIAAFSENKLFCRIPIVFTEMIRRNIKFDGKLYTILLSTAASMKDYNFGKQIIDHMHREEFKPNTFVYGALIQLYSLTGNLDLALDTIQAMKPKPQNQHYNILLMACANTKNYPLGERVYRLMREQELKLDVQNYNILIKLFGVCDMLDHAMNLFEEMKDQGVTPTPTTYSVLFSACTTAISLETGTKLYHSLPAHMLENEKVASALIDMFGKLMDTKQAEDVFHKINKTVPVWNNMINAYGINGEGQKALELFRKMKATGCVPDEITIMCVLTACSHTHLVSDAFLIYHSLGEFGIKATLPINSIMVDILARACRIDEAVQLAESMDVTDLATWRSILGACRSQNNVQQGEYAAQQALKYDPYDATIFVLLSQLYASAKEWKKRTQLHIKMDKLGIKKQPSVSTLIIHGKPIKIFALEIPSVFSEQVDSWSGEYFTRLQAIGYKADLSVVVGNITDNEKRTILCRHSEKTGLIIALNQSKEPIRMFNSLRVCKDCHNAAVLTSQAYNREIFIKDARRTHHFKDGKCNCNGLW
jgi:pentatricopeptide repeat protein